MSPDERTAALLDRVRAGQPEALGELFESHRDRLWRMLFVSLDRRLGSRVSPDDVLQEAFLDVSRRIGEHLADPAVPFYVWLRFLVLQRLQMVHRHHLGAKARDAAQEVAFASPDSMAGGLAADGTSPSQAAMRGEMVERLRAALDAMDPLDREVLALRHFEEMGNNEVAQALGISKDAASKRHVRALVRLREILSFGV
ncbi:MAG: sigma-70 family RNA polymerase sigma factor [Gemmataceae bacterium]|nr:sigma-70 family RNA polymerase sigma factor [Gemmataceae bacterium]